MDERKKKKVKKSRAVSPFLATRTANNPTNSGTKRSEGCTSVETVKPLIVLTTGALKHTHT